MTYLQQPRKATASELWSTLPAPRSELLPQMRKDYQALALANSLDPKRFMKGSTKLSKVPQTFAVSLRFFLSGEIMLISRSAL